MFNEFEVNTYTDLQGRWQTYDIFTAPIYNHNVRDFGVPLGWAKDSNQLLVKLQYAFRY